MKIKTNVTEKTPDDATVISWLGRIPLSITSKATSSNNIKQITKAVVHGILITLISETDIVIFYGNKWLGIFMIDLKLWNI